MTRKQSYSGDPEVAAMATLAGALDPLPEEARGRVLLWARSRYGSAAVPASSSGRADAALRPQLGLGSFPTLSELMGACSPDSDDRRVLVAAAFLSEADESGTFTAAQVNRELKHLGRRVENITRALDTLIAQRPAMVVQLRKSGTSRQSRKLYKVTDSGLQEVQQLLAASP